MDHAHRTIYLMKDGGYQEYQECTKGWPLERTSCISIYFKMHFLMLNVLLSFRDFFPVTFFPSKNLLVVCPFVPVTFFPFTKCSHQINIKVTGLHWY